MDGDAVTELGPESRAGESIVKRSRADEVMRESASAYKRVTKQHSNGILRDSIKTHNCITDCLGSSIKTREIFTG